MTTTEFDRNELLRQALEPAATSGCPPLAELLDALFSADASSRSAELRAHAAGCSACGAEVALAGAFDATPKSPAEAQQIAWVVAQLTPLAGAAPTPLSERAPQVARVLPMAAHTAKRAKLARQSAGMSLGSRWAAAALIVLGLGLVFEWGHRSLAPALPDRTDALSSDVVRSGEIRLDAPIGVVVAGIAELPPFTWRPVTGAASYRVEVRDVAGDLLWQGSSALATLAAPVDLQARLETMVTYRWSVTALDAAASVLAHSATESFRVEPPVN